MVRSNQGQIESDQIRSVHGQVKSGPVPLDQRQVMVRPGHVRSSQVRT